MNNVSLTRAVLASLLDMARDHVQDIESGIEDGTYSAAENADLDGKKAALEATEAALKADASSCGVAFWDAYSRGTPPAATHAMDVTDQRSSSGQMYVDVATNEGAVDDLLALTIEVNENPLVDSSSTEEQARQSVPCVHVSFDGDNVAISLFKVGNDILMRPEQGVSIEPFTHGKCSYFWVK